MIPNADDQATVTLPDVEIVRVGRWLASQGDGTITEADLNDILTASRDPEIDQPALRVGHIDPRFDGEPALGFVTNLRMRGQTLIGDITDVPRKFAKAAAAGLKRRSAELASVTTPSGRRYHTVLTGLALLGVQRPAVKGLADIAALYSDEQRPGGDVRVIPAVVAEPAAPIAEVADVTYDVGSETSPASGLTIPVEPAITGGEPVPAETTHTTAEPVVQRSPTPESPAPAPQPTPAPAPAPQPAPVVQTAVTPTPVPVETTNRTTLSAGVLDELRAAGLSVVTSEALTALQSQAADGAEARRLLREQEIDRELGRFLNEGRIAPADRDRWREAMSRDLDGTKTLLSAITPAFPTSARGSGSAVEMPVQTEGISDADFVAFERQLGIR